MKALSLVRITEVTSTPLRVINLYIYSSAEKSIKPLVAQVAGIPIEPDDAPNDNAILAANGLDAENNNDAVFVLSPPTVPQVLFESLVTVGEALISTGNADDA